MYTHVYRCTVYIYIYIEREREGDYILTGVSAIFAAGPRAPLCVHLSGGPKMHK